jgi:hypothetical protein
MNRSQLFHRVIYVERRASAVVELQIDASAFSMPQDYVIFLKTQSQIFTKVTALAHTSMTAINQLLLVILESKLSKYSVQGRVWPIEASITVRSWYIALIMSYAQNTPYR